MQLGRRLRPGKAFGILDVSEIWSSGGYSCLLCREGISVEMDIRLLLGGLECAVALCCLLALRCGVRL